MASSGKSSSSENRLLSGEGSRVKLKVKSSWSDGTRRFVPFRSIFGGSSESWLHRFGKEETSSPKIAQCLESVLSTSLLLLTLHLILRPYSLFLKSLSFRKGNCMVVANQEFSKVDYSPGDFHSFKRFADCIAQPIFKFFDKFHLWVKSNFFQFATIGRQTSIFLTVLKYFSLFCWNTILNADMNRATVVGVSAKTRVNPWH